MDLLGDGIHTLTGQFETDLEEFLGHGRLSGLQVSPGLTSEHPGHSGLFSTSGGGSSGGREKGQFTASGSRHNELGVCALWQIVPCLQDATLEEIESIWLITGLIQDLTLGKGSTNECWSNARPEFPRLRGNGRKGLQDQAQWLVC